MSLQRLRDTEVVAQGVRRVGFADRSSRHVRARDLAGSGERLFLARITSASSLFTSHGQNGAFLFAFRGQGALAFRPHRHASTTARRGFSLPLAASRRRHVVMRACAPVAPAAFWRFNPTESKGEVPANIGRLPVPRQKHVDRHRARAGDPQALTRAVERHLVADVPWRCSNRRPGLDVRDRNCPATVREQPSSRFTVTFADEADHNEAVIAAESAAFRHITHTECPCRTTVLGWVSHAIGP